MFQKEHDFLKVNSNQLYKSWIIKHVFASQFLVCFLLLHMIVYFFILDMQFLSFQG